MRLSIVAAMKERAAKNFKLKDTAEFVDFELINMEEINKTVVETDLQEISSDIDVIVNLRLGYEGCLPDSYRVLNSMVSDWVDDHDDNLKKIINPKLIPFLKEHYKDIDTSDLQEDFDDYIWEDQVDYMIYVDEYKKYIYFSIELVLEVEESDEGDEY